MGCGSVKTIDHEAKQIKAEQNKNQNENKTKNKSVDIIEIVNKESTVSSKKMIKQGLNTSRNLELTKSTKTSKFRRIEGDYTTVISATQDYLPEVIAKIDKTEGEIGKKYYDFEVKASRYEIIYPIWLIKDEEVEFYVEGKWKISKDRECDSKGLENQDVILFPERINDYLDNK